jgi:hypothetical protein
MLLSFEGEAYRTRLDIGNIFKQGGTADDAKSSIETFNNKWGDRDFGGGLTESLTMSIDTSSAVSLSPFFSFSIALNAIFFLFFVRVPKIKAAKPSLFLDTARMFRLNEMSKMEFVHKMNVIQNKNATKLILHQQCHPV